MLDGGARNMLFVASPFLPSITSTIRISLKVFLTQLLIEKNSLLVLNQLISLLYVKW